MVWIKQKGGEGHCWVCSKCRSLLMRVQNDQPLPEKCPACGAFVINSRRELLKAILNAQCHQADAIEYGRERKKRAAWLIEEATDERIVVQCSRCREYLAVNGFWESHPDLIECPHCFSAMGGVEDG